MKYSNLIINESDESRQQYQEQHILI